MLLDQNDIKQKLHEANNLKRFAFYSITLSSIATITAIILVPMLYNYVQYVYSSLDKEIDFCHHRTNDLWEEYRHIIGSKTERTKRQALKRALGIIDARENISDGFEATVSKDYSTTSNSCSCITGEAGPFGLPGQDGKDGKQKLFILKNYY